ncbi:hypothetical protein L195_g064751, partial [Trifolium pratense]
RHGLRSSLFQLYTTHIVGKMSIWIGQSCECNM